MRIWAGPATACSILHGSCSCLLHHGEWNHSPRHPLQTDLCKRRGLLFCFCCLSIGHLWVFSCWRMGCKRGFKGWPSSFHCFNLRKQLQWSLWYLVDHMCNCNACWWFSGFAARTKSNTGRKPCSQFFCAKCLCFNQLRDVPTQATG